MNLADTNSISVEESALRVLDLQHSKYATTASSEIESRSASLMLMKEILRAPREIGAICPSSTRLGERMASLIDGDADGVVVELGAGTGVITESLLRRGIAPNRLILVEKSELLARHLSERFPEIRVIHADAADIPVILAQAKIVKAVVSSLPLRSLPGKEVTKIAATWAPSLTRGGRVIQFTYAPFSSTAWLGVGLERISSETVWANLPPARVEVFSRA